MNYKASYKQVEEMLTDVCSSTEVVVSAYWKLSIRRYSCTI